MPFGRVDEGRVQALEEALRVLPNDVTALRARALGQLALELMFSPEKARAMALAEDSVQIARVAGDDAVLAAALSAHATVSDSPDIDPREALIELREVVRLADKVGLPLLSLRGRWPKMLRLLQLGEGELDREIETLGRKGGRDQTRGTAPPQHGVPRDEGDGAGAARSGGGAPHGVRAEKDGREHDSAARPPRISPPFRAGRLEEIIENVEAGRSAPRRCRRIGARSPQPTPRWAEKRTHAVLERVGARRFEDIPLDWAWLGALSDLSTASAMLRDAARSAILYEAEAVRRTTRGVVHRHVPGTRLHYLGILAATFGRYEDTAQHFDDALTGEARMGARPWRARTQYAYAEMLVARGEPGIGRRRSSSLARLSRRRTRSA